MNTNNYKIHVNRFGYESHSKYTFKYKNNKVADGDTLEELIEKINNPTILKRIKLNNLSIKIGKNGEKSIIYISKSKFN